METNTVFSAHHKNILYSIEMIRSDVKDGVTIRNPSTANLLIDSADRTSGQASNFIIQKNNSILNGFFSRIGVSEVVLNWGIPNVSKANNNNTFTVRVNATPYTITLVDGFYTVAAALDRIVYYLNNAPIGPIAGATFVVSATTGNVNFTTTQGIVFFSIDDTPLARQLGFTVFGVINLAFLITSPYLLPYRYIDFVSPEITYNQSLKDASTAGGNNNPSNAIERTVLYRWYLAWDESPSYDEYGFPVLQGYTRFVTRRILPFPKQVRWENNMPIGQLSFQVYNDKGELVIPEKATVENYYFKLEWAMTLLVSED
jgi:hypothetical protein